MPYSINILSKAKILNRTFTDFWRGLKKYIYNDRKKCCNWTKSFTQRVLRFLKKALSIVIKLCFLMGNEQQDVSQL